MRRVRGPAYHQLVERRRIPELSETGTGNGGGCQDALDVVPPGPLPVSVEGELVERRIRRGGAGREDEGGGDCSTSGRDHWPPTVVMQAAKCKCGNRGNLWSARPL